MATTSVVFSPTPSSAGMDEYTSPRETSRSNSHHNIHDFVQQSLQHGPLVDFTLPENNASAEYTAGEFAGAEYNTQAEYTTEDDHTFFEPLLPKPLLLCGDDAEPSLYALPDHILQVILSLVDVGDRLRSVPLVCTRFRDLLRRQHHSLWNKLQLPSCDGMSYKYATCHLVHALVVYHGFPSSVHLAFDVEQNTGAGLIAAWHFVYLQLSGLCVMVRV